MIRLGIIGCAEIAFRRFMPAVKNIKNLQVIAVAEEYDRTKLQAFCSRYDLEPEDSFEQLIAREDIDAVYVPQPPAYHYKWAKKALEKGKHVLIEKPSTIGYSLSKDLTGIARSKALALHENYMFQYHSQLKAIKNILSDGRIGEIRLMKANFGFPLRAENDFRYSKNLGGGALLDAAGYTVKLAAIMLGETVKVDTAKLNYLPGFEVDMYGSVSLSNSEGMVFQAGFGMDCAYQCNFEVWGSKGRIYTDRIFTAPADYQPQVRIETNQGAEFISLESDSHFQRSIEQFLIEITDAAHRDTMYKEIILQAKLIEDIRALGEK